MLRIAQSVFGPWDNLILREIGVFGNVRLGLSTIGQEWPKMALFWLMITQPVRDRVNVKYV